MESYKIKVSFTDGTYKYIQASKAKLIASHNVLNYVFEKFNRTEVKEIKTRSKGQAGYYWTLNYNRFFEQALNTKQRIEAINAKGYEDYTGYGNKTEGKINRFYIGRSTGWVPCYLEILKNNSSGGGALFTHKRQFRVV